MTRKSFLSDAQWIDIFNTGKRDYQIKKDLGCTKDTIGRARRRLRDCIEIPFVDKNTKSNSHSKLECFHEELRNMRSWNWTAVQAAKFLFTAHSMKVTSNTVIYYWNTRFEVAS